jgi:hypothetical protein
MNKSFVQLHVYSLFIGAYQKNFFNTVFSQIPTLPNKPLTPFFSRSKELKKVLIQFTEAIEYTC